MDIDTLKNLLLAKDEKITEMRLTINELENYIDRMETMLANYEE